MSRNLQHFDITHIELSALEKMFIINLIDEGTGRSVFNIPEGFVLKIARNKKGLIENENENYIFHTIPPEYKDSLCPVIRYETKYLIMPKAQPLLKTTVNFNKVIMSNTPVLNYLQKKYDLNELDLVYPNNWGIYMGRFVLFDYGSTYIKRLIQI